MMKIRLGSITILFMIMSTCTIGQTLPTIKVYGHRGARALRPENTIPAYDAGLKIGIDMVDMDVNMTKDGTVVVAHDFALNPDITQSSDGQWISSDNLLIKDIPLSVLKRYSVGQMKPHTDYALSFPYQVAIPNTSIPTLEEVIQYVKARTGNKVGFQVEIKTDPTHPQWTFTPKHLADATVKILKQENVDDRTELQAFDWRVLLEVQKLDPKIKTAYLTDANIAGNMTSTNPQIAGAWSAGYLLKNYNNSIPKMIKALGGNIWGPEAAQVTKKNVQEAHNEGIKVVVWTINTEPEINRMIDVHVDGIISDRPDIVRGILASRGYAIPPSY